MGKYLVKVNNSTSVVQTLINLFTPSKKRSRSSYKGKKNMASTKTTKL